MTPLALAVLVAAAPVPKTAETDAARIARLFGEPTDPDKTCTFRLDGDGLVVGVPDKPHDWNRDGPANAPRTARPTDGDFDARVRVTLRPPADNPPGGSFWAGLAVTSGTTQVVIAGTERVAAGGAQFRFRYWEPGFASTVVASDPRRLGQDGPLWVRVVRRGRGLTTSIGLDGKEWHSTQRPEPRFVLPERVSVGVFAAQTTGKGFAVLFDQFRLDPIPAEGGR